MGQLSIITNHHIRLLSDSLTIHIGNHVSINHIIGINIENIITRSIFQAYLTRMSHTRMHLMKYLYSSIFTRILITNSRRLVRASVIHQDDFYVLEWLGKKSIYTMMQISGSIIKRNDDGNIHYTILLIATYLRYHQKSSAKEEMTL